MAKNPFATKAPKAPPKGGAAPPQPPGFIPYNTGSKVKPASFGKKKR